MNAGLGLIGAPLALLATLGSAGGLAPRGRRSGADRLAVDPDGRTARRDDAAAGHRGPNRPGEPAQHNTLLAELAGTGRLSFHNLDQVRGMKSDDDPDPLTDPAIEVRRDVGEDDASCRGRSARRGSASGGCAANRDV